MCSKKINTIQLSDMEALVFEKSKKSVTLEKVPIPELVNDDDVQIQVRNCGVCGTDVHIFHGAITNVGDRFIPGHEAGGVVTAIGSKVTGVKVGDNVAVGEYVSEYSQTE